MKAILIILLITLSSCDSPVEKIKCLLRSDFLFKSIAKIIDSIQTKDISNIIFTIVSLFPQIKNEVKKCFFTQEVNLSVSDFALSVVSGDKKFCRFGADHGFEDYCSCFIKKCRRSFEFFKMPQYYNLCVC